MKLKISLIILLSVVAAVILLITLVFWNAKGNLVDLVAGQFPAEPRQLDPAISQKGGTGQPFQVTVKIDPATPITHVAPEFLSFSIDASQVTGGKWWDPKAQGQETGTGTVHAPIYDFNRSGLDTLVEGLSPAYLRVGGSESDKVYYDLAPAGGTPRKPPAGYQSTLTNEEWDALNAFAARHQLKVVFTLNAGPASRQAGQGWDGTNAAELMAYTKKNNYPVSVWELGNEVNNFWFVFGPQNQISTATYSQDLVKARQLVNTVTPLARLGGQGSMFWPVLGEPLSLFYGFMPGYLQQSGSLVDLVSWHYYPQQSRRGPVASRRASPSRLLDSAALDEAGYWADKMAAWRDAYAPGKPLWLGETGNAQFGGEPGLSDAYLGGLWWLDELGLMAQKGTQVVVRQTLSGSNYGMIDDASLAPRPDYWNSLLWKRLMGPDVYGVTVSGDNSSHLRAYVQAIPEVSYAMLLINLDPQRNAQVNLPWLSGRGYELYSLTSPDLFTQTLVLNGQSLALAPDGQLPKLNGNTIPATPNPGVVVHPLSYTFVVVR